MFFVICAYHSATQVTHNVLYNKKGKKRFENIKERYGDMAFKCRTSLFHDI